jgi:hypothetical protein
MELRRRAVHRLTGLFVRWDLIEHPYGRDYARERYSLTGRRRSEPTPRLGESPSRTRAAMIVASLVLASLLATGLLFATAT